MNKKNALTKTPTQKTIIWSLGLLCLLLLASIIIPGGGVWLNIAGMLESVAGVSVLISYNLSPQSRVYDLDNYVPLNVFDERFGGANKQIATKAGLTGEPMLDVGPYYEGYTEYRDTLSELCWTSFIFWVLFILVFIAMYLMLKKRGLGAFVPAVVMLGCIFAAPLLCVGTLVVFNTINAGGVYITTELTALIIFLCGYFRTEGNRQKDGTHIGQEDIDVLTATTNADAERIEEIIMDEPVKFSLAPVGDGVETSAFGGTPACELAIDKDMQSVPNVESVIVQEETPNQTAPAERVSTKAKEKRKYCSRCGNEIDPTTKKCTGCGKQYFKFNKSVAIILVLVTALASVSTLSVYQFENNQKLQLQIDALKSELKDVQAQKDSQTLDTKIAISHMRVIIGNQVHKIDCPKVNPDMRYRIIGIEGRIQAILSGYKSCPVCN